MQAHWCVAAFVAATVGVGSTATAATLSMVSGEWSDTRSESWTTSAFFVPTLYGSDLAVFRMFSGGPFLDPALTIDAATGWSQTYSSGGSTPHTVAMSGPATAPSFNVGLTFAAAMSQPFMFEVAVFQVGGANPNELLNVYWDGFTWLQTAGSQNDWRPTRDDFDGGTVIPLPGPAALTLAGLAGVAGVRRRKLR
jgi:uncharacterized protein (TIGR03382 family)